MGDVTISRGIGFRDDLLDASLWTLDSGVGLTTDGDIGTITVTTASNGASRTGLVANSTSVYPKLLVRATTTSILGGTFDIKFTYTDASTQTFTMTILA